MKKKLATSSLLLLSLFAAAAGRGAEPRVGLRCDFDSEPRLMAHSRVVGAFMVPRRTVFRIADVPGATDGRALVVEANNSSGFLLIKFDGLDLKKYPYMRWRWRIVRQLKLAPGGSDPDDQPCVVYLIAGSRLNQKCLGYRWEFNTPVGTERMINYGMSRVKAFCLRDRQSPAGEWVVEERDLQADYRAAFGIPIPAEFVIGIGGNSQYSRSDTRVEIDYIEFRSAPAPGK